MSRTHNLTTALAALLLAAPASAYDLQTPGNDTKLSIYGFVYVLGQYFQGPAQNGVGSLQQGLYKNVLSQAGSPDQNILFSVQPSRFGVSTLTPSTEWGDFTTKLEFDLNGQTAGTAFHLRHAVGTVGAWTFGHTWSNWVDLDAGADEVDWAGPVGQAGWDTPRRPQVRYTWSLPSSSTFALSVENNKGLDGDTFASGIQEDGKIPTVVGAYTLNGSWGHIGLRAIAISHGAYVPAASGAGSQRWQKESYGAQISGSAKLAKDTLVYSIYDGTGIADWGYGLQSATISNTAASPKAINLYRNIGWLAGYTHVFTDRVRGNLIASGVNFSSNSSISTTNSATGTDIKSQIDYIANVYYTFNPKTQLGFEFVHEVATPFGSGQVLGNDGNQQNSATENKLELVYQAKF
jgi:hypothetical protein